MRWSDTAQNANKQNIETKSSELKQGKGLFDTACAILVLMLQPGIRYGVGISKIVPNLVELKRQGETWCQTPSFQNITIGGGDLHCQE